MKTKLLALTLSTMIIGLMVAYSFNQLSANSEHELITTGQLPQVVQAVDLSGEFSFAGELIPTQLDDVRERLDRELLVNAYRHSSTMHMLKLSRRYFPVIESILKQEGLPTDLKYLAMAESGLRMATSPAGAKGLWQFMKGTGREKGLEINSGIDERLHVEKSTRAACSYLKDLRKKFGSWTLAAAAYNMGPYGLNKEMNNQKASRYFDLNINDETMRYVFRIVALKYITEHPETFGFYLYDEDYYKPHINTYEIAVDTTITQLGYFAQNHGLTYRQLKIYNPWILKNTLPNASKRTYYLKFPRTIKN